MPKIPDAFGRRLRRRRRDTHTGRRILFFRVAAKKGAPEDRDQLAAMSLTFDGIKINGPGTPTAARDARKLFWNSEVRERCLFREIKTMVEKNMCI